MPTYQYHCLKCGHELKELQSFAEPPLTRCPACNTDNLVRGIGGGAGLIFKGSGFYLTDYAKSGEKSTPAAQKPEEKKPGSSPPKTSTEKTPPPASTPPSKAKE